MATKLILFHNVYVKYDSSSGTVSELTVNEEEVELHLFYFLSTIDVLGVLDNVHVRFEVISCFVTFRIEFPTNVLNTFGNVYDKPCVVRHITIDVLLAASSR